MGLVRGLGSEGLLGHHLEECDVLVSGLGFRAIRNHVAIATLTRLEQGPRRTHSAAQNELQHL